MKKNQLSDKHHRRHPFRSLQAQLTTAYTAVSFIMIMVLVFGGTYILTIYHTVSGFKGQQLQYELQNALSYAATNQTGTTLDIDNLVDSVAVNCELENGLSSLDRVTTINGGLNEYESCPANRTFFLSLRQSPNLFNTHRNLQALTVWQPNGQWLIIDREGIHEEAGAPDESQMRLINYNHPASLVNGLTTLVAAPLFTREANGQQQLLAVILLDMGYENPFGSAINWSDFAAQFILILVAAFLVGLVGSAMITRRVAQRIRHLEHVADIWATGDFSVMIRNESSDEIGQLGRRLNQMAEHLQQLLAARMQLTAVEERNRLARDLHDAAKQQVFAIDMQLYTAENLIDNHTSSAKTHLQEARRLTQEVRTELDSLIAELRPAQLDGKGLFTAVRETIAAFERQTQLIIDLRLSGDRELPLAVEQPFFRIFQEALSNVARHSNAAKLIVSLHATNDQLRLTVRDNGIGFDPAHVNAGVGQASMQERIAQIGGQLQIESEIGKGTAVIVTAPLHMPL